jgi:N-acetylmuramoyl-L-alanine amidase
MRSTLQSQPENQRRKADYEKVIRMFREVYRLSPTYSKAPVALAAIAELYEQMGGVFATDRYYLEAIKAYEFLISQYPQGRLARDALFAAGEIYRADLENPELARLTFQQYLAKYPKSAKAREAREHLNQIDQLLAEQMTNLSAPSPRPAEAHRPDTSGPPEVTAIRRWVGPHYSRIVIASEGEVKFNASRLRNPDRIVLDLENTRLGSALVGKTFPVEDGFLRQIRVAQFTPTVTRVVLDVEKIEDFSVLPLPNPFRLVIDIHGTQTPSRAKAEVPAPAPATPQPGRPAGSTPSPLPSRPTLAAKPEAVPPSTQAQSEPESAESNPPRGVLPAESSIPQPSPAAASRQAAEAPAAAREAEIANAPPTLTPQPTGSRTLTRALGLKIGRIVIDPGHGGHDTGTIGPTGLMEKDLVLDVGLRLQKLLERKTGCEVILTRSEDNFVALEERTAIANQKAADLFLSIHANASRDRNARGIETYYLNFTSSPDSLEVAARENATSQESVHQLQDLIKKIALTEKIEESQEFARRIQEEIYRRVGKSGGEQRDRGVKKAPFVVLIGANMPSVLAEISFLTNPRDERLLKRPEYRQRIAEALQSGILDYMKTLGGVIAVQRAASGESQSVGID